MKNRFVLFVAAVLFFSAFAPVSAVKICQAYVWRVVENTSGVQVHLSTLPNGGGTVYARLLCTDTDPSAKAKMAIVLAAWQNRTKVQLSFADAAQNCGVTDYTYFPSDVWLMGQNE
jgi:hypothetical protein